MKEFEALGFKVPKMIEHKNGIQIYVPDNKDSNDWCIHIPPKLLKIDYRSNDWYDKAFKNGFDMYSITESEVIGMVMKYSTDEEKEQYGKYMEQQKEQQTAVEKYKIHKRVEARKQYFKQKHKDHDRILELRSQGLTYREIGEQVGCSYQTAYNI